MLWVAIHYIIALIVKLLVPPPARVVIRKIDVNAPCPSCGHTQGHIRAMHEGSVMVVQHSCHVCRAAWNEAPVVQPRTGAVLKPAPKITTEAA